MSDFDPEGPADDGNPFGTPEVGDHPRGRRRGLRRVEAGGAGLPSSQVTDSSFFLQMPIEAFRQAFGSEWFIEHDSTPPMRVGWLFDTAAGDPPA